jgi:hypothetical protein
VRVFNQKIIICISKISFTNIHRLILAALVVLVLSGLAARGASAQASDVYITPDGGGNGVCTNNTHPPSWFNNSGNWGSGSTQIGPGTIVHLCGTISTELDFQGDGASGRPFIILFESGAQMAQTSWRQAFFAGRHSYWKIDGGTPCGWDNVAMTREGNCNGVVKNTSSMDNNTLAIEVSGSHDYEITNLEIGPLYQHVANTGPSIEVTLGGCIYANGAGMNGKVSHSYFHDAGWCVNLENMPAGTLNFVGDHMYMEHISHFFQWGGCNAGGTSGYTISNSRLHEPANWDSLDNAYHHDGIQVDPLPAPNSCSDFLWENNVVDGDWGVNNTSPIFLEQHTNQNISRVKIVNSTFASANGHVFNNGAINAVGYDDLQIYNNTIVCPNAGIGMQISGTHLKVQNNIFSACSTAIYANFISATSWTADTNNVFDAIGLGGSAAFIYQSGTVCCSGSLATQLAQWQTHTGGSGSITVSNAQLNPTGSPQTGSPAIGVGSNLSALGIAALGTDIKSAVRPSSGSWTSGAFSTPGSSVPAPTAPTGLKVTVTQ